MKTWTRQQARDGNTASPETLNLDLGDAGGSFATLDRTQLPSNAFDKDTVPATSLVQVWAPFLLLLARRSAGRRGWGFVPRGVVIHPFGLIGLALSG